MRKSVKLRIEQSEVHQKIRELNALAELTPEQRDELDTLSKRAQELEPEIRGALTEEGVSERAELREGPPIDSELRERLELRERASLGGFVVAALRGRALTGAEAELQQAANVPGIPLELWETRAAVEQRARRVEHRATTPAAAPAATTVGTNLDLIRPAVFAPSIADRLMIEMPMVESGTYATATISTSITADAVARSAAVPETSGALTTATTGPHRVGASLRLTVEDIAAIGAANFEAAFRENVSMVLSDELDDQMINGDAQNDDLNGILKRLSDPTAASGTDPYTWTQMLAVQSGGIDGLWATELRHIGLVVNPETYRLAAATFQGSDAEESAAAYMERTGDSFFTNKRMPDKASHLAQAILCRKGRMGMRTAVCPHWGYLDIDDIYSGATKGERGFTVSALVGDVILVQPDAYAQVVFRVSK